MIKRIIQYITYDIWFKKEVEYRSARVRWAVRQFKVFLFTAQGIGEHSILVRSAALTFYTLMSLVPFAALFFGIAKGFDLETKLSAYLFEQFPQYEFLVKQIIEFANALLQRTRGGWLASIGAIVLFWSVLKVFGNVESSFNRIWEVHRPRSIARKFSDYFAVLFVTPILLIISNTLRLQLQEYLLPYAPTPLIEVLFWITSLIALWAMFTFLYRVMPNTKVKWRYALLAGALAGSAFMIFQTVYVAIQSNLSNYNAIYGSFAAVPLFLIWLQASWQIVLFGAELSFAYQNIKNFEHEKSAGEISYHFKKRAMVLIMHQVAKHFVEKEGAVSSEVLAREVNLPIRLVRDVLYELERADLVASLSTSDPRESRYVPARDVHGLRAADVIERVENMGNDPHQEYEEQSVVVREVDQLLRRIEEQRAASPDNQEIIEIGRKPSSATTQSPNK